MKMRNLLIYFFLKFKKLSFGKRLIIFALLFRKLFWKFKNLKTTFLFAFKNLNKLYVPSLKLSKGNQFKDLFDKIDIIIPDEGFIVSLDIFKTLSYTYPIIENMSIDYSKIINSSLNEFKKKYSSKSGSYAENQMNLLESIEILIDRQCDEIKKSNRKDKGKYIDFFENIKHCEAKTFEEALQRILFFNQILWQTGHNLNGWARLDYALSKVYENDDITKNESLKLIKDFLKVAHEFYYYKSTLMLGDTGQIIVLGGKKENEEYFYNDLTSLFIQAVKELNLPDPKLILRVCENTPRHIWESALDCISTGVGSPLLSNDDVIIPKLIDFGYLKKDAYNYVVSACWEPAPLGVGLELNNIGSIVFLKPLNDLLDKEDLLLFNDFDSFYGKYKKYLVNYIAEVIGEVNNLNHEEDPLLSLFIDGCDEKQTDISQGGAIYNNYGLTSVSLSNTVNSLLNIKKFVFINKEFSLTEFNSFRKSNFDDDRLLDKLKESNLKFGLDDNEVINLTNDIVDNVSKVFKNNTNKYGGKFRFGLSSPTFIGGSSDVKASFDGRRNFEPFNVHISSDNSDYMELMRFASKLDYSENKFNGNVVDFMVTPTFIKNNFDKFLDFLILSFKLGIFQMQMNVTSSETLIKAKENPELYPNLIVRVWGFSAYFNDLPEDYQNLLIKRALENEGRC